MNRVPVGRRAVMLTVPPMTSVSSATMVRPRPEPASSIRGVCRAT